MRRRAAMTALLTVAVVGPAAPALADHTDPGDRLSPIAPGLPAELALSSGEGEWQHLANVGPMQGTDLEFFVKDGVTYVSGGTLGQVEDDVTGGLPVGTTGFVGQRILRLTDASGTVLDQPEVVADHGSASCSTSTSATGLQHDVQAVPLEDTSVLVDTTDATGRCHDSSGGGLEIIDVSGLGREGFEVRELGLLRFNGLSHTVTADRDRPGILYNNGADFNAQTWIDVVDVRSCLFEATDTATLEQRRAACQPEVYRMPWEPEWAFKAPPGEEPFEASNCHDITYQDGRLYCAGLNATLLFDVSGMFEEDGDVRGQPLPCETGLPGTETGALVTDCALRPEGSTSANPSVAEAIEAYEAAGSPQAEGWEFLGSVNHAGRACPDSATVTCNTNLSVPATEDVAVSHEVDPSLDGRFMFVTDERGGGVVPPGATCVPSLDNPVGNGGIHAYDISSLTPDSDPQHARTPDGAKAVYIGGSPTPSAAFCTVHVIEHMPDEQRLSVAYYDGGTKIVDYFVNPDGTFEWKETASYRLPGANTWASEVFSTQDNADGTRTYWFVSTSFALGSGTARGFDLFTWTGPTNPIGSRSPTSGGGAGGSTPGGDNPGTVARALPATGADAAVLVLALVLIPAAVAVRVLRRRLGAAQAG